MTSDRVLRTLEQERTEAVKEYQLLGVQIDRAKTALQRLERQHAQAAEQVNELTDAIGERRARLHGDVA